MTNDSAANPTEQLIYQLTSNFAGSEVEKKAFSSGLKMGMLQGIGTAMSMIKIQYEGLMPPKITSLTGDKFKPQQNMIKQQALVGLLNMMSRFGAELEQKLYAEPAEQNPTAQP